jgi:hypothetical protein
MSSLIFLITMSSVGWLVLWALRDPKEPKWDWWPIEWWPFDTQAEAQAEAEAAAALAEQQSVTDRARVRQAVPWRQRRIPQPRRVPQPRKPVWKH